MTLDTALVIEVVATLTATGALMWFIWRRPELGSYGPLAAKLAGVLFLCGLFALGLKSAGYILVALIVVLIIAYVLPVVLG
jgi:hypothetical protein